MKKIIFLILISIVAIIAITLIFVSFYNNIDFILRNLGNLIGFSSIIITSIIGFYYNKKYESFKIKFDKKIIGYTELINYSRAFMNDPSLDKDEKIKMANNFLIKYHNEILPFGSKEVILSIQDFLFNSGTNYIKTTQNTQTTALANIIKAIRNDLSLEEIDFSKIEFHAINEINFEKKS